MTSTERRACTCARANHQHGTSQMYNADHCRCDECRTAKTDWQREARRRAARLRWTSSRTTLRRDGTGTRRRLQALCAIGWSLAALAGEMGVTKQAVALQCGYETVSDATAARVADVYDRLSMTPVLGPDAHLAKVWALRRGWVPPLAWDDETIDDPDARPHGLRREDADVLDDVLVDRYVAGQASARRGCNPSPELLAAVALMHARGMPDGAVGDRVGMTADAIWRMRSRHGIGMVRAS